MIVVYNALIHFLMWSGPCIPEHGIYSFFFLCFWIRCAGVLLHICMKSQLVLTNQYPFWAILVWFWYEDYASLLHSTATLGRNVVSFCSWLSSVCYSAWSMAGQSFTLSAWANFHFLSSMWPGWVLMFKMSWIFLVA